MRPLTNSLSVLAALAIAVPTASGQETATTDPVGFVTVGITAGTGTAKRNTLFSLPLLETESINGQVAGTITGVTANTISNSNAGWTAGELSNPATPYLIMITSGAAEGRMFLISSASSAAGSLGGIANTSTTATVSSIDSTQVDLTSLGLVAGTDTYRIYACDTIGSFFGTPESTGIQGGSSAANADVITLVVNGSASNYFYNTGVTPNRWSRVAFGNPASENVPLLPYYGIQYARMAATPLSFVVTGNVPTHPRMVSVKNSGTTLLAQYWPADSTIASLGLNSLPGWRTGATAAAADTIVLTSNGSATTYFFDGVDWRRVAFGNPKSNDTLIGVGATVMINRKGAASGYGNLNQDPPYNLN